MDGTRPQRLVDRRDAGRQLAERLRSSRLDRDQPVERMRVRPALAVRVEALFHEIGVSSFFPDLHEDPEVHALLRAPLRERAIGVIYRPETERRSHYVFTRLSLGFDVVFHHGRTRAVGPLEPTPVWIRGESDLPETWPTAL